MALSAFDYYRYGTTTRNPDGSLRAQYHLFMDVSITAGDSFHQVRICSSLTASADLFRHDPQVAVVIAALGIAVYVVGLPLFALFVLWKKRQRLTVSACYVSCNQPLH